MRQSGFWLIKAILDRLEVTGPPDWLLYTNKYRVTRDVAKQKLTQEKQRVRLRVGCEGMCVTHHNVGKQESPV